MRVKLVCVGTRMPDWVNAGVEEYSKRIRQDLGFELIEVPLASRGKNGSVAQFRVKEAESLLAKLKDDDHVVALEVTGRTLDTEAMASELERFRADGKNLSLLIGGPDGLDGLCLERADARWSLSALTLPHTIARVLLVEQLYRALTLIQGHPYHRS